jgi:uncharacterized protein (DUF1697 family)
VASVVLLRGVNVGGHKTFRPARLAEALKHLDVVNIGAAGTFVVRRAVSQAKLRAEFARRLPFDTEIIICSGKEISGLLAGDRFSRHPARPGITRFVSVLSRMPKVSPPLPMTFPPNGTWMLKVLARERRIIFGVYRRHMKAIGYLGKLDRVFGVPATTRNVTTIDAIAKVLSS